MNDVKHMESSGSEKMMLRTDHMACLLYTSVSVIDVIMMTVKGVGI